MAPEPVTEERTLQEILAAAKVALAGAARASARTGYAERYQAEWAAELKRRAEHLTAWPHAWRRRRLTDPDRPVHLEHARFGEPRHIAHPLAARHGQPCRVFARGRNGNLGVEFTDGFRVVAPRHAIRRRSAAG